VERRALPNHPTTPLASGTINASSDTIEVVLVQLADMPAVVRIVWPQQPTITTPAKLNETAATVMRILANAVTAYTQIKATKHLDRLPDASSWASCSACHPGAPSGPNSWPRREDISHLERSVT
jgi:hypothetical protein